MHLRGVAKSVHLEVWRSMKTISPDILNRWCIPHTYFVLFEVFFGSLNENSGLHVEFIETEKIYEHCS